MTSRQLPTACGQATDKGVFGFGLYSQFLALRLSRMVLPRRTESERAKEYYPIGSFAKRSLSRKRFAAALTH